MNFAILLPAHGKQKALQFPAESLEAAKEIGREFAREKKLTKWPDYGGTIYTLLPDGKKTTKCWGAIKIDGTCWSGKPRDTFRRGEHSGTQA